MKNAFRTRVDEGIEDGDGDGDGDGREELFPIDAELIPIRHFIKNLPLCGAERNIPSHSFAFETTGTDKHTTRK